MFLFYFSIKAYKLVYSEFCHLQYFNFISELQLDFSLSLFKDKSIDALQK